MIAIFVCGGTFDKKYDEITGRLFFKDTHVAEMLRLGRSRVEVSIETLMMIDSLEMTDADRQLVADRCRTCERRRIVITHGTDTMVETAATIAAAVTGKRHRRVLLELTSVSRAVSCSRDRAIGIASAAGGRFSTENSQRVAAFTTACLRRKRILSVRGWEVIKPFLRASFSSSLRSWP